MVGVGWKFWMVLETKKKEIVWWNFWIVVDMDLAVLPVVEKRCVVTIDGVDVLLDVDGRDGAATTTIVDWIEEPNTVDKCTTKKRILPCTKKRSTREGPRI